MQDDMLEDFDKHIKQELKEVVQKITDEVKNELTKNADGEVYESYNPTQYTRTYNLKRSITVSKNSDTESLVEFDSGINNKISVNGENVSDYVPKWINGGHSDKTGIDNMFHNYPSRNFIDKTVQNINGKYGENVVEIVDNAE